MPETKACAGRFGQEAQDLLTKDLGRARWHEHTCEVCGQAVEAQLKNGKWIPKAHWPSVKFQRRNRTSRPVPAAAHMAKDLPGVSESA